MAFTNTPALLLLALLPLVAWLGWPRLAYRRRRDTASLLLRTLLLTLVTCALAGAQIVRAADRLSVVFVLDVSDSVDAAARQRAVEDVRAALDAMRPDDQAAVVAFGETPIVERPLSNTRTLEPLRAAPPSAATDLAAALRLALALLPDDTARRIVVYSDGRPTTGDALAAAQLAAATSVSVDYVPLTPSERAPEVQVTRVDAPATVNAGQVFDLSITVDAEAETSASIGVYASGELVYQQDVDLRAGPNRYTLPLEAGGSGFRDFRVQVTPREDGFFQNNVLDGFSRVVGPPRVLVLRTDPAEAAYLVPALRETGLDVDERGPTDLPIGVAALAPYQAVVLVNVPATALSTRRQEALASYVRDLGGGLVVVGGPNAYGPGGYFATPLEDTLPVESRLRDQQRLPQLTIGYLIDTSGSMAALSPSGVSYLELGKEAIIRSLAFMQPTDRAGIASFDTAGTWVAPIQPVLDQLALQTLVAQLGAGGGTDILAGLRLVGNALLPDPSQRKHIILLSDGYSSPDQLVETATRLRNDGDITLSIVAIGMGQVQLLADMAAAGGGNYHVVDVVEDIPTIFTIETVLATRAYISEEPFTPVVSARSPILTGILSAPTLQGYVATTARDTAQVILRGGPFSDPLLATWQVGLGRAVAFTSDATARWGQGWVTWDDYARFWSQTVRWTISEGAASNLQARVVAEGSAARVIVEGRTDDGDFLNGLALQLSLVAPDLAAQQLSFQQVAPGRYEAVFTPGAQGAYLIRVQGEGVDGAVSGPTTGWVRSYSPEYDLRDDTPSVLPALAAATGGRDISAQPAAAFDHNLPFQRTSTPLWPWLLALAALLLPVDVAVRRLVLTHEDWARVAAWLRRGRTAQAGPSRAAPLLEVRERARARTTPEPTGAASTLSALRRQRAQATTDAPPPPPRAPQPPPPAPTSASTPAPTPSSTPAPTSASGSIGARLLEQRRQRPTADDTPPPEA